ncbi:class I SAM-dependent methyltransferase [Robiginitalea marina]|uniref:Class I SAM-dependent methyltransferase n=1 Tax=Robiginitalea marina TaxID=2954105 RepID=A0ABT1ATP1_9FLAO|nr:class I SAM-dependent methyltransferase [Robiginitalea marina]MCO5723291.1 class I SAM-dependent methyltransferase [Robiginitalea marina]
MSVSLGRSPFPGITPQELAQQLSGYQKAAKKLPLWHGTPGIYYPPTLNLAQASSEQTARYKASLVEGESLVDLTGGFGADTYFFSKRVTRVHYCEQNASLAEIATHNFQKLGAGNIRIHPGDGLLSLGRIKAEEGRADWIYLDPSRRREDRGRVFLLEDCQPPLPDILPQLFRAGRNLLLKTSPMLDLSAGVRQLGGVREIHIVAINNEVKELLWWLQEGYGGEATLKATDLAYPLPALVFTASGEASASAPYAMPLKYLYEPNAAILKAGGFKTAALAYGLLKLHPQTHLYTSDALAPFPGRRFEIRSIQTYKPGKLPFKKANVSARNFPETVARIRQRNRIADGGDTYLFFVRCMDESLQVLDGVPVPVQDQP